MNPLVLVVEDDPRIRRLLLGQLQERGFRVVEAETGHGALRLAVEAKPDLILLDYGLPDMTGLEVCRAVREWADTPIILLTVHDDNETRVATLNAGADDYVTKPFHLPEVVARIQAVLRRSETRPAPEPIIRVDSLVIDLAAHEVTRDGESIHLTRLEFSLLRALAQNPDRVLTYDRLLEEVWGPGYDDIRLVHVHVSNLRRKVERDPGGRRYILSVPGVGYRFRT